MQLTVVVPESVIKQVQEVHKLCERCETGRLNAAEVAATMGRDKRSLLNSMQYNHCPFGFISSDVSRMPTIPVAKFYFWFMGDYLRLSGEIPQI